MQKMNGKWILLAAMVAIPAFLAAQAPAPKPAPATPPTAVPAPAPIPAAAPAPTSVTVTPASADATSSGKLAPAKWLFSNDPKQNRDALSRLSASLAPKASEITWLAFAHSAPLQGLAPLAAFARER